VYYNGTFTYKKLQKYVLLLSIKETLGCESQYFQSSKAFFVRSYTIVDPRIEINSDKSTESLFHSTDDYLVQLHTVNLQKT